MKIYRYTNKFYHRTSNRILFKRVLFHIFFGEDVFTITTGTTTDNHP